MFRQSKKYAMPVPYGVGKRAERLTFITGIMTILMLVLIGATSCDEAAMNAKARIADEKIVTEICSVWTPVTDTTSPQVRGINRARYAFCEG